jgi:hypothetical protein
VSIKTNAFKNFPPGSPEAVEKGCDCPILDNSRGKGAYGGGIRDSDGDILYWINQKCPLHGENNG